MLHLDDATQDTPASQPMQDLGQLLVTSYPAQALFPVGVNLSKYSKTSDTLIRTTMVDMLMLYQ